MVLGGITLSLAAVDTVVATYGSRSVVLTEVVPATRVGTSGVVPEADPRGGLGMAESACMGASLGAAWIEVVLGTRFTFLTDVMHREMELIGLDHLLAVDVGASRAMGHRALHMRRDAEALAAGSGR